jgi:glycosyltransferase involved in cell wall biosynthesis
MSKTKLLVIQRVFSHYRKPLFDRLDRIYHLKVLHAKNNNGIKQLQEKYSIPVRGIRYYKKDTNIYLPVVLHLFRFRPAVVIHEFNPSLPSLYILLFLRIFMNYKLILWGHGINSTKILKNKKFSIKVRRFLSKLSDAVILYGNKAKKHFQGFTSMNKIFIANNTLDTSELLKIKSQLEEIGKEKIKRELNITSTKNIIFIGRLLESKILPSYFINILEEVNKSVNNLQVQIIGDGPAKEKLEQLVNSRNINNIIFRGAIHKDIEVGKYLLIADLALIPGAVGLAVNHAFVFNTPITTFEESVNGPFHGPEREYIVNNKTGYMAKNKDIEDISNFIIKYLNSEHQQKYMKTKIEDYVKNICSIEYMVKGFIDAINYCTR